MDMIIVGGGLVGLGLALFAAEGGLRSAVVERGDLTVRDLPDFDGRSFSIGPAVRQALDVVGVWKGLESHAQPVTDILVTNGRVNDGASPHYLHFDQAGTGPHFHMLENRRLNQMFLKAARDHDEITLIDRAEINAVDRDGAAVTIDLADGRILTAPVIAAGDGARSALRDQAGIKNRRRSYDQKGLVTTVVHEEPHEGVAQEYFLTGGPFAILPLCDDEDGQHRASLVWTEKTSVADAILAMDEAEQAVELAKRFGDYLGPIKMVTPLIGWPLSIQMADDYIADRLALIGDAAHVIHPLAGQGLNLGLKDAAALAEVLVDARRLGLDPGSLAVLDRYQRWRRFDNMLMAGMTDGLNALFSNDDPLLGLIRNAGLELVNRTPPLKNLFRKGAAASAGPGQAVPKLLAGQSLV